MITLKINIGLRNCDKLFLFGEMPSFNYLYADRQNINCVAIICWHGVASFTADLLYNAKISVNVNNACTITSSLPCGACCSVVYLQMSWSLPVNQSIGFTLLILIVSLLIPVQCSCARLFRAIVGLNCLLRHWISCFIKACTDMTIRKPLWKKQHKY